MNRSVVQQLILKDWRLHRMHMILSIAGGVLALAMLQVRTETTAILGGIWFFVALIVLGSMLPTSNILNERKKQTLPFLMSLPISATQYTMAKIVSTAGMFLGPWLALLIAMVTLIATRPDIPKGLIPMAIILAGLTLVGFCLIAGTAVISESEGWTIAATVVCNSSYGFMWYLMGRIPEVSAATKSAALVWSPAELTILGAEAATIVVILGLALYVQSRKRDFI